MSAHRFLGYCHEQAYLLAKGNPLLPTGKLDDVLEWRYTGNRWHPTQKPVPSLKPVIETFTCRGDIVLDPFCGSGSILLAAKILGRRYIGIELDAKYARTAESRLVFKNDRRPTFTAASKSHATFDSMQPQHGTQEPRAT